MNAALDVTLGGALVGAVDDVTTSSADPGIGTASLVTVITTMTSDDTGSAADEVSLANGTKGQIKIFTLKADTETTGTKVVPATMAGGSDILFEDVGDGCTMVFDGTSWVVVANNGGTIS